MDLQERLRAHMRSELANTPVSDLGGVMERGETIRRRRRAVMTAAPVVVVVLGVVGVMASGIMSDEDAPDADQVAAAEAELSLSLGTRDWAIEAASLGWAEDIAADDGVFYALSTAPGVRWEDFPMGNLPKALYVSSDGRNWSPTPFGEWRPAGLAAADGLLYVVGTAPGAAADTQTLEVRISRDGGASFESIQLPVSVPAGTYFLPELIAADDGVLAVATIRQVTDPFSLLPPEALVGEVEPLMIEDGIAVFPRDVSLEAEQACFGGDAARCAEMIETDATAFFSWEDLGIPGAAFGETTDNIAFWSPDGEDFEEIEYPFGQGFVDTVTSVDGTVVVSVAGMGPTRLFASEDAREWRPIAEDTDPGFLSAIGKTHAGMAMVAQAPDGNLAVFRAPDLDGPWEEVPLADALAELTKGDAQVWPTGAAVIDDSGVALTVMLSSTVEQRSNPIVELVEPIFGRDMAGDRAGGRGVEDVETQGLLLVSDDLTEWQAVSVSHLGGFVDLMLPSPDGSLVAYGNQHDPNGRAVRVVGVADR